MNIFYPLELTADYLSYGLFNLIKGSHLGDSVNFFIYDSLKILLLLLAINYLMAIIRHYLPIEKLRDFLASRKWYGLDYLLAAVFGTITPFCSCSSIPLFIGFLEAGIPLGVTLSFLIVSPLVNQVAVVLFAGLFGWKVTVLYVVAAVSLGVVGGFILSKLKLEKYVTDYVRKIKNDKLEIKTEKLSRKKLLFKFWREGLAMTKKITPYVLIGIAVGAAIHGFVPAGFFENYITAENLLAVPVATIVAVPMYANAVGVIPIMQSLVEKGIPLGTAMAFMLAIVGLSLPEALILKRVMKVKLLIYFFGVTTINIMIIGYLFNAFVNLN
ncbi:TPA: permease [Candidatus Falkowbacteria bacterium]|nr:MAG: Permease [Candidatus Falkowbacteria bacterium GW2011_GWF2_43_32]HBA36534.1 permease [Candidatus Falkowbacteria bacterium]